jgi:hypothetical protein
MAEIINGDATNTKVAVWTATYEKTNREGLWDRMLNDDAFWTNESGDKYLDIKSLISTIDSDMVKRIKEHVETCNFFNEFEIDDDLRIIAIIKVMSLIGDIVYIKLFFSGSRVALYVHDKEDKRDAS